MLNLFSKRKKPDPFGDTLPPEQKEAWRIAGLLTAYIAKKQTRKEKKELNEWLKESDDNVHLFERLTDENFIAATKEIFNTLYELQKKSMPRNSSFSNN